MKRISQILFFLIVGFICFMSCKAENEINPLQRALSSEHQSIRRVMDHLNTHEIQIRYTQIDRKNGEIAFKDYDFQLNDSIYFYPASTVKFPAAVAALEKLGELDTLGRNARFYIEGDSVETTFSKAISQIFAVSDNAANNRLVEFLGQDEINNRMKNKGVAPIRISHRLSTTDADNPITKPLVFYLNDSTTTLSKPIANENPTPLQLEQITKGTGFYADGVLHQESFDFSLKNYFPIAAQSDLLKRIIFPEAFPKEEQFKLSTENREFLLTAMSTLPEALGYDTETYYDSYVKFFLFGDQHGPIPSHLKIYNKVGYAYGTLTDSAYIKDTKNNIDFMITATLLVNADGVFNDDLYEYDSIGIPFLAQLGRELYTQELDRN